MKKYIISILLGALLFTVTSYGKEDVAKSKLKVGDLIVTSKLYNEHYLNNFLTGVITKLESAHGEMPLATVECQINTFWLEKVEPVRPQRLTINEMIDIEIFRTRWEGISKYNCVRCGEKLKNSISKDNYYCTVCKTGFNIKEE